MTPLTPRGTARERFLREWAAAGPPEPGMRDFEADDFEPAYLGWELSRCVPDLPVDEQRAVAALAAACIAAILGGSTRLPIDEARLASSLAAVGAGDTAGAAARLIGRARSPCTGDPIASIIGLPGARTPLILEGSWLYTERMRVLEDRFCARVRRRAARPLDPKEARALLRATSAVTSGHTDRASLTVEQKRAVRDALQGALSLITGGPGTGKTTTVVALVRALAWMGMPTDSVAIAAPTGKAAQRLAEALTAGLASGAGDIAEAALAEMVPAPLTLHRLLGWSALSGRFARHENDPLPYRVVIVDEASMVDLAMMDRLVRALRDDARLVLLGDADQLPSVEAGAVFRDLCAGLGAARLTANLRVAHDPSARTIVAAALAVNGGTFSAAIVERRDVGSVAFEGAEHLGALWSDVCDEMLGRWWETHIACDEGFLRRVAKTYRLRAGSFDEHEKADLTALLLHHGRCRLLCATRVHGFPASVEAINQRLCARLRGGAAEGLAGARPQDLPPGTPVLVQRNDYVRGLYNGDQGVVVRVQSEDTAPRPMAVFSRQGSVDALPLDAFPAIAPAFAMTVHKAQGSEFDHVGLVFPDSDLPIVTRELVYTAITRARRSVLLVGARDLVARAMSRTIERHSGVAERLLLR